MLGSGYLQNRDLIFKRRGDWRDLHLHYITFNMRWSTQITSLLTAGLHEVHKLATGTEPFPAPDWTIWKYSNLIWLDHQLFLLPLFLSLHFLFEVLHFLHACNRNLLKTQPFIWMKIEKIAVSWCLLILVLWATRMPRLGLTKSPIYHLLTVDVHVLGIFLALPPRRPGCAVVVVVGAFIGALLGGNNSSPLRSQSIA